MKTNSVGARIKAEREAQNLTQETLAEMAGVSPGHISVIERGVKLPNLETFISIANALCVSADALLIDVVEYAAAGATSDLSRAISGLRPADQKRIINVVKALIKEL